MLWNFMKNHLATAQTNPTQPNPKQERKTASMSRVMLGPFSIFLVFPVCLHKRHLLQSELVDAFYVGSPFL